jgi:hypothetical protein
LCFGFFLLAEFRKLDLHQLNLLGRRNQDLVIRLHWVRRDIVDMAGAIHKV